MKNRKANSKLIIKHHDGSTTEVTPLPAWQPDWPVVIGGKSYDVPPAVVLHIEELRNAIVKADARITALIAALELEQRNRAGNEGRADGLAAQSPI